MTEQELHLQGIQASQAGRHEEAVKLLRELIQRQPEQPVYHANLGLAFARLGDLPQSIHSYRTALQYRPHHGPTLAKLGRVLASADRTEEALAAFRGAIASDAGDPDTWNALGAAYANMGRFEEACASFERALMLDPTYEEAHNNHFNAICRLGEAAVREKAWDRARGLWERAAAARPSSFDAHYNLGFSLSALKQPERACECYERALAVRPGDAKALNNLAHVRLACGDAETALACLEGALASDPTYVDAAYNLGVTLQTLDRPDEALEAYRNVLKLNPSHADTLNNVGSLLLGMARPEEAIPSFEAAIASAPDHLDARWNLGLAHLALGDFEAGWLAYETRLRKANVPHHDGPAWAGEDLSGRTLLVWCEQGLGDTVQFLRFLPALKAKGARIIVECQPRLYPLIASYADADQVVARGDSLPPYDFQVALLSLPFLLKARLETLPAPIGPATLPASTVAGWSAKLGEHRGFKVGLCWSGNPMNEKGRHRSANLAILAELAAAPGVEIFSLQRNPDAAEIAGAPWLHQLESEQDTVLDTACIISQLDLVITVDTMVAHLAASLGRPTWILLHYGADWRWMLKREDSPWYPSARLFRQSKAGDWSGPVKAAAAELAQLATRKALE